MIKYLEMTTSCLPEAAKMQLLIKIQAISSNHLKEAAIIEVLRLNKLTALQPPNNNPRF